MQKYQFRRAAPETIGDGQVRIMPRGHDVQEGMVEDGENGVVHELQFEPGDPVRAVDDQFVRLSIIEPHMVVSMAKRGLVLNFCQVGENHRVHRLVAPRLA